MQVRLNLTSTTLKLPLLSLKQKLSTTERSCGCTVPTYSKAPIQPNESGEIEIKYDTKKLGAFTKTITVTSNAEGGNKILKIKGNIVASQ